MFSKLNQLTLALHLNFIDIILLYIYVNFEQHNHREWLIVIEFHWLATLTGEEGALNEEY